MCEKARIKVTSKINKSHLGHNLAGIAVVAVVSRQ
jgi:hypothetical protein